MLVRIFFSGWACALLMLIFCLAQISYTQFTNDCGQLLVTKTISQISDATAVAKCSTFTGDIVIASTLPAAEGNIDFGNLQEIDGGLSVRDCPGLTSLMGSQIQRITGELTLEDVTKLARLGFPRLTRTNTLTLNGMPRVGALDFSAEGKETTGLMVTENVIIINTLLPSLGPINLRNVSTLAMWNNTAMETITLPLQVVNKKINIKSNSEVNFPLLPKANNITLRDVSSISLPALTSVSDFLASGNITSIDMPKISNATNLQIQSTNPSFNCSILDSSHNKTFITGTYECLGTHQPLLDTSSTNPSTPSNSTKPPRKPTSKTITLTISISVIAGLCILATSTYLICRNRKAKGLGKSENSSEDGNESHGNESHGNESHGNESRGNAEIDMERTELDGGQAVHPQLAGGRIDLAHELESAHGVVEIGGNYPRTMSELEGCMEKREYRVTNWI